MYKQWFCLRMDDQQRARKEGSLFFQQLAGHLYQITLLRRGESQTLIVQESQLLKQGEQVVNAP
ncbi:hypothetical protein KSF_086520 [Reticulibacter mediterranei]|uniref:Uncharacterized protein n=1 Tax=Reticulibacter mediterranei TaxID=2778369 RepID=A0A8J3N511_9CHLR|nr:hypothetical protein KSF_086520 [Reticulibacter mediterranei]